MKNRRRRLEMRRAEHRSSGARAWRCRVRGAVARTILLRNAARLRRTRYPSRTFRELLVWRRQDSGRGGASSRLCRWSWARGYSRRRNSRRQLRCRFRVRNRRQREWPSARNRRRCGFSWRHRKSASCRRDRARAVACAGANPRGRWRTCRAGGGSNPRRILHRDGRWFRCRNAWRIYGRGIRDLCAARGNYRFRR